MRNKFNIVVAATLMTGVACAQNAQEFNEISEQLNGAVAVEAPKANVDALIEASRAKFLDAEFAQAQMGFEEVIKIEPENVTAKMYLRSLLERNMRESKADALKEVDAAWCTGISMRSYALSEDALEKMDLEDIDEPTEVAGLFPQVDFPKGTTAVYQPEMKTIFVRNTMQNFEVLDAILDAMGVLKDSDPSDQVEIEAKFVEVSEGALEELGFLWDQHGKRGAFDDGPDGLFADSLRGPTYEKTPAGDGFEQETINASNSFSEDPADLTLSVFGKKQLDLIISALDQGTGADMLSAPRITTKSGEEATIRVGDQHYFPEVYEVDSSDGTLPVVAYQDFEEKVLGVELVVTPEIEDNNVTLSLNPRVSELSGWQKYRIAAQNSMYSHRQNEIGITYIHGAIEAKLPVFSVRQVETEVTIESGNTLMMGGLISEKFESFEDKVPLLGDIPLVGRLFRKEGEKAVKNNLVMFVTANIVEPSGYKKATRAFE